MKLFAKLETLTSRILFLFIPYLVFLTSLYWLNIETSIAIGSGLGILQFAIMAIWKKRVYVYPLLTIGELIILLFLSRMLEEDKFQYLLPVFMLLIPLSLLSLANYKRRLINNDIKSKARKKLFVTYANVEMFAFYLNAFYFFLAVHILAAVTFLVLRKDNLYQFETGWGTVFMLISYAVFGVVYYFVTRQQMKHEEWLSVVDETGGVKGKATRKQCHGTKQLMHPVVHIHLIRGKSIYLQKRPDDKFIQPGKWDTAVGGHLNFGEDIETGLKREAFEELGLKDISPRFLIKYVWETEVEKELVYTFYLKDVEDITVNRSEVEDGKYWPVQQVKENLGKGVFTPNFEKEFEFIEQIFF